MSKVSVVIPARNEQFLQQTITDLITKAKEEIEVIAVLDGYWPNPTLKDYPNLVQLHFTESVGMRSAINAAVRVSTGKYIMKTDAHCMFADGYDVELKKSCEKDWMVVPSRYSLKADIWERGRGPIDYLFTTYPYIQEGQFGFGLHGKKWLLDENNMGHESYYGLENTRKDILIDDIMAFQGSCWFIHKDYFTDVVGYLDDKRWYSLHQEAQEMICKVWLSGGRCVVNKNTWYAHLHKGQLYGRGYRLFKHKMTETERDSVDYWMFDQWPGQKRKFEWLIDKFWPVPGWPDDWKTNPKYREEYLKQTKGA